MKQIAFMVTFLAFFKTFTQAAEPVGQWDLLQSDGRSVADLSPSGLHGKVVGGRLTNGGLFFDGDGACVEIPSKGLRPDKEMTLVIWVNPTSLSRQRIAGKPHFDPGFKTPMPGLMFGENRSIQAAFWDKGGKNKYILDGKTEVGEGGWTHVAFSIDEARAKLFINGKLESEVACGGGIGWNETPLYVGRIRSDDKTFRGQIGEVRFYKEALGESEILSLYAKGRPLYPAPTASETKTARTEPVSAKTSPKESWREYPTRTLALLENYSSTQDAGLDVWGGSPEKKYEARGFFYAREDDGRWHLVDPEGNYFIHVGVVAVAPGNTKSIRENFGKNFKSKEDWADQSAALLKSQGFNGSGAWSEVDLLRGAKTKLAYTVIKNFMSEFARTKNLLAASVGHSGYVKESIPVFHPDFEAFCAKYAEELKTTKDDPALLGIFSDNEIQPPDLSKYLSLDPNDKDQAPNYQSAKEWLIGKTGGSLEVTPELKREFMAYAFEKYFSVVSKAIKAVDPNHLYIGSRFHASEKNNPLVWKAIGKYLDVISVNYYGEWSPDLDLIHSWTRWSGKPVIITEWYTKGDDVGFPNTTGAGWIVKTQTDRGKFYQNFALGLLESRGIVGWHWFKYMDNDPNDPNAEPSNKDSNKGIVKVTFETYEVLLTAMRSLNRHVYSLIKYFDGKK